MNEEFFKELKEKIQKYFESGGSHEIKHTERVYNNAVMLAKEEKADLEIVRAAALLHDISRGKEDEKKCKCHAEDGAKQARKILIEMKFPKEKIDAVCEAIRIHRHSAGINPKTKEQAIIQDADRLDALGAVAIARMFSSGGKLSLPMKTTIKEFDTKILKITPETFKTKKAKEIAKGRYNFILEFLDKFSKENREII